MEGTGVQQVGGRDDSDKKQGPLPRAPGFEKHQLTLGAYVAPTPDLQRTNEMAPYETGYTQVGLGLGYHYNLVPPFPNHWLLRLIKGTGAGAELGYSYTGGDEGNLGSHRHQAELMVRVRLGILRYLYVEGKGGLGFAANYLNFGKGFPLEGQFSLNSIAQFTAGLEYCFGREFCPSIFGGYRWENTLYGASGLPDYTNGMFLFGFVVRGNLRKSPEPEVKVVTRVVEKPVIVEREKIVEKPVIVEREKIVEKPALVTMTPPPSPDRCILDRLYHFQNDNSRRLMEENRARGKLLYRSVPDLNDMVIYLVKHPDVDVQIHGYANREEHPTPEEERKKGMMEPGAYDRVLSLKRALWTQDYLNVRAPGVIRHEEKRRGKKFPVSFLDKSRLIVWGVFLDKKGRPIPQAYNEYWRALELGAVDAEGPSVHGDGRLRARVVERLPYPLDLDEPEDPSEFRNRCIRFREVKK